MALTQFPEPKSLNVLEIGDSKDNRTVKYSLENPHPMYGKDPNIINELGHTIYPKMIYPNGKDQPSVIVYNAREEAELLNKEPEEVKAENHSSEADEIEELEKKLAERKAKLMAKLEANGDKDKDENGHPWS